MRAGTTSSPPYSSSPISLSLARWLARSIARVLKWGQRCVKVAKENSLISTRPLFVSNHSTYLRPTLSPTPPSKPPFQTLRDLALYPDPVLHPISTLILSHEFYIPAPLRHPSNSTTACTSFILLSFLRTPFLHPTPLQHRQPLYLDYPVIPPCL